MFILELRREYHRHQILYRFVSVFISVSSIPLRRSQSKHIETMVSLNQNKPVWIRDNEHGFVLGKITDIGTDQITVQLNENRKV